jgi:hypothetical protein
MLDTSNNNLMAAYDQLMLSEQIPSSVKNARGKKGKKGGRRLP